MKKTTHVSFFTALLFTLFLLVIFTGCNSAAGPDSSAATSSESATSSSQEPSASPAPSPSLEKITLVLDWNPNTNHTGLYVAAAKDYFKEAGFDVSIVQPPEDGASAMVASGQATFGIDFQDSIAPAFALDHPLPVTAVAAIVNHNTSGIISLPDKGITSPKHLEGKTYATWDLPVEKAMIKNVVEANGGDFSKVKLIPSTVTDVLTALQTDVDAVWVYYGWDAVAAKVKGIDTNFFYFKDINPVFDYYSPILIANNDYLREHPDQAKAFLAAVKKGYDFAIKNPKEAADLLVAAVPELDSALIHASQEYLSTQYQGDAPSWGYMDPVRWNGFYQWLGKNQLIPKEIPDNFGFSNEYLQP